MKSAHMYGAPVGWSNRQVNRGRGIYVVVAEAGADKEVVLCRVDVREVDATLNSPF